MPNPETNPLSPLRLLQNENARLKDENQELKEQNELWRHYASLLNYLHNIRLTIKGEGELLKHLGHTLEGAMHVCRASDGSLLMLDSDSGELVFVQVRGTMSATLPGLRLKMGEGIIGWVAQQNTAQLVNDPYHDARFARRVDQSFKFVTRNLAAAPIRGLRTLFGVLAVLNKHGNDGFNDTDLELLNTLAGATAAVIERVDTR